MMKATKNKIDIEAVAKGISDNDEIGSMFFSIINQKYNKDQATILCSGIRSYANSDELLTIFKSVKYNNFSELVTKSCDKILETLDKMVVELHNKIVTK